MENGGESESLAGGRVQSVVDAQGFGRPEFVEEAVDGSEECTEKPTCKTGGHKGEGSGRVPSAEEG